MFGGAYRALHFAIRPLVVARHLGPALVAAGVLSTVPACVALLDGHADVALRHAGVIAVLLATGLSFRRLRCTDRMQVNEAMVISVLAFAVTALASAYPIMAYGLGPLDAVFEAVSGVTTTGLSTLASIEGRPHSFLFLRAWLQWLGGLGVVVLVLALLAPRGLAAKRLGFDEGEAADFVGSTHGHARRVLVVYVVLTLVGMAAAAASGLPAFESVVLSLAAISTGGFAIADSSLIGLSGWSQAAVCLTCLMGGVTLAAYGPGRLRHLGRDAGLWTLVGLSVGGWSLLALFGMADSPDRPGLASAFWLSVSAQTTAGFATVPSDALTAAGKLILIVQMLIGGDVGSTAGGLKLLRLVILVKLLTAVVVRVSLPGASEAPIRVRGERVGADELEGAAVLGLAYVVALVASWFPFLVAGYDPLDSLFDVASALATAGLSVGVTGPDLEPHLKGVLCLDMLMGRVEIVAFFVLFFPGTWIGRRRSTQ